MASFSCNENFLQQAIPVTVHPDFYKVNGESIPDINSLTDINQGIVPMSFSELGYFAFGVKNWNLQIQSTFIVQGMPMTPHAKTLSFNQVGTTAPSQLVDLYNNPKPSHTSFFLTQLSNTNGLELLFPTTSSQSYGIIGNAGGKPFESNVSLSGVAGTVNFQMANGIQKNGENQVYVKVNLQMNIQVDNGDNIVLATATNFQLNKQDGFTQCGTLSMPGRSLSVYASDAQATLNANLTIGTSWQPDE